jgi:5,10-methylenetetrahydromethanopterin reductase
VKFSVRVNNDLPFAELVALAGAAEQAGFDQLWFSNDLFLRSAPVLAGALAVRTGRIGLGIAVMNPYSVHVSELAMAAATAQEVSGGRFLLGLGAGAEQFLGWAGLARPRPLAVTRTALVALRALLGHEDVDRTLLPEWFGADSVLRFPLERPVPVYVGAMGPKMLEMAGRHADGVLPLLYPPERYATVRPQVLAGAALAGTGLAGTGLAGAGLAGAGLAGAGLDGGSRARDVDLPACFWVSVSDDAAAARAALAEKLAYYGPSIPAAVLAGSGLRPQDFAPAAELAHGGHGAAALIDDRMLSLGVAGDGADVLARCRALTRLGASHLSFGPPLGPDPVAAVRLLGEQVLPALQEAIA